ncbi:hypothetical protein RCH20_001192 [Psychrobacter sp. PL15]|uniref:hypothetical protein n=1 Tax=Psychrobacter sp. PL15 TaxID=3071719 RepID=UPI002E05BE35|nr:hypothetical protein [Psychrobacter sp. PL15]
MNNHKKQGVLNNFSPFLININYVYHNFRLSNHKGFDLVKMVVEGLDYLGGYCNVLMTAHTNQGLAVGDWRVKC